MEDKLLTCIRQHIFSFTQKRDHKDDNDQRSGFIYQLIVQDFQDSNIKIRATYQFQASFTFTYIQIMDSRLYEAAEKGNIELLQDIIKSDHLILRRSAISNTGDNALHVSCLAGHRDFVIEFLKHGKEFIYEPNHEGLSPLHIAAASGNTDIVKELLKVDLGLCLLRGKERRIPLHFAAIKGRVQVVEELLLASMESIEIATSRGETALHLAVKNNQFDVLSSLIEHMDKFNKVDVINMKDELGDTVFHLAVAKKQHEVVDLLLKANSATYRLLEVNSTNKMGYTPLDMLLLLPSEAGDIEIHDIIKRAGGLRAIDMSRQPTGHHGHTRVSNDQSTHRSYSTLFRYNFEKDKPSKVRDVLLLISTLITTATFQAGLTPPKIPSDPPQGKHDTGIRRLMIFEGFLDYALNVFLVFNTLGFILSLHMINILIKGFPLAKELRVCMVSLGITYLVSLMIKLPEVSFYIVMITVMALPFPVIAVAKLYKFMSDMRSLANEEQRNQVLRI